MFRRLTAALLTAAAIATFAITTVRADQPAGVMCEFEFKGTTIVLEYLLGKFENMGDAVKRCLNDGGHPVGVVRKGAK